LLQKRQDGQVSQNFKFRGGREEGWQGGKEREGKGDRGWEVRRKYGTGGEERRGTGWEREIRRLCCGRELLCDARH